MRDESIFGAIDVELAYLGACLSDMPALEESTLIPDDFENPRYGKLFARLQERLVKHLGVSQVLLAEDYANDNDMFRIIWSSTDALSELLLWQDHEDAIRDRAVRRKLQAAAVRIADLAKGGEAATIVDQARAAIDAAAGRVEVRTTSMRDDFDEVLQAHRQQVNLVPSPWRELNETIGGFGPGRVYTVGARPGVGKSAIATQIAYELAGQGPVVFATMEMDKGEVYSRIISQQAEVYYGSNNAPVSDYALAKEREWLRQRVRDIRVMDAGTQTVAGIRAAVRAANHDAPVAGVVVDYIHLLSTPVPIENEVQRISEITRSLKQLSMDMKVPVIALSQLNRAGDEGRPALKHLRGGGSIEQDSDVVMFLYRDENSADPNAAVSVFVAKNRQGPPFVGFDLQWQGEFVRAVDMPTWAY